jgi:cAMP-dependent protein kinase regulator
MSVGYSPLVVPSEKYLQTKRKSVFSRPYEQISQMEEFIPPVYEKSQDQIIKLIEILKNNFLTKNLSQFELKLLADAMQLRFYKRNDMIIRYGDVGNEYFILDKGVIEIQVYQ